LRRRVADTMSASLGRPVHLDGVSLQLLPIPGLTLQNLVVSEDPAFGSEPVIRANVVEITLRPSSLWRRQVELSSIRFVEPSLNLVRNAEGRWNLESLLMHAAEVDTAPTEQSRPGPAPRFPYIEATNGRVNVKLGQEKQPFSLTDADFALWLPSAEQWRVRLVGKPMRTDMNVADTGTVRLEGQLQRAARMSEVPVDLRGSWHDAPLGEASRLLTGSDANWRGKLNADLTLIGPLGAAKATAVVHFNDLRRADFVPVTPLDLAIECNGSFDVPEAIVHDPSCALPTPVPAGSKSPGQVVAIADTAELQKLNMPDFGVTGLRLGLSNVANSYLLEWARLFSQRLQAQASLRGIAAGSMVLSPDAATGWQGEFHTEFPDPAPWETATGSRPLAPVSVVASGQTLTLAPLNLIPAGKLMLTGEATLQSYQLHLAGEATLPQLKAMRATLPPFGDGLETVLPELLEVPATSNLAVKPIGSAKGADAAKAGDIAKPIKVDVTCTRAWGGMQTCSTVAEPAKPAHGHRR
jgi:AsmA protein